MSGVSVLVPTKNQEESLPGCLESIVGWCDDIHVFDAMSTDGTVAFAQMAGARVTSRRFDDWPAHQNWSLHNINFKHDWVLCVNADEWVSSPLAAEVLRAVRSADDVVAFRIPRRVALGERQFGRGHDYPNPIRLFKPQYVHHKRLVDLVTVVNGRCGRLTEYLEPDCSDNRTKHWFGPRAWFDREARTIGLPRS